MSVLAHSLGSVIMYDLLHETCLANGIRHDDPISQQAGQIVPFGTEAADVKSTPVCFNHVAMETGMFTCMYGTCTCCCVVWRVMH